MQHQIFRKSLQRNVTCNFQIIIESGLPPRQRRGGSRGRVQGVCTPPPEMTCGFLIQLVFCQKKTMWFIGAPPPKKNPGSAPGVNKQTFENCSAGYFCLNCKAQEIFLCQEAVIWPFRATVKTPLYGQPLNTDTSLLRIVCFIPWKRKP